MALSGVIRLRQGTEITQGTELTVKPNFSRLIPPKNVTSTAEWLNYVFDQLGRIPELFGAGLVDFEEKHINPLPGFENVFSQKLQSMTEPHLIPQSYFLLPGDTQHVRGFCFGGPLDLILLWENANSAAAESLISSLNISTFWLEKLRHYQSLVYIDDLSGLYNYRYLETYLGQQLRTSQESHSPLSVLFIDVDNFKVVNDRFGHLTGSEVLKEVGRILKTTVREIDQVVRYGGDEFVVLLVDTDWADAKTVAERIRQRVASTQFAVSTPKFSLTLSIGVASCPRHATTPRDLLARSDEALYLGKNNGKNQVVVQAIPESVASNEWTTAP